MTIVFNCDGCGKRYEVDSGLAGKKAVCKDCRTQFVIPIPRRVGGGPPSAPVQRTPASAQRNPSNASEPSRPVARPAKPPQPIVPTNPAVDLFGLDDGPSPPRQGRGPVPARGDFAADDRPEVLPKRASYPKAKAGGRGKGFNTKSLAIGLPAGAIAFAVMFAMMYRVMSGGFGADNPLGHLIASVSGDTEYDRLIKKMLDSLEELAGILEKIQSPADSQTYRPQLQELQARFAAMEQEANALPNPSQSENNRLESTYDARMKKAIERVTTQSQRLQSMGGIPGGFMPRMPGFLGRRPGLAGGPQVGGPFGPPAGFPGPTFPNQPAPPVNDKESITLVVSNVSDDDHDTYIVDEITAIGESFPAPNGRRTSSVGSGTNRTWTINPIPNAQAFADKIKFGRVTSVKGRTINVVANALQASDRRPVETDVIGRALFDLKSANKNRQRDAAQRLSEAIPTENRSEVANGLIALLESNDAWTRKSAVKALGVWGTADQVPALVARANDPDHGVQEEVIRSLGQRKDPRGADAIVTLFDKHRGPARDALIAMGPAAEEATLQLLRNQDVFVRTEACKVLQEIGGAKSMPSLQTLARRQGFDGDAAREAVRVIKAANANEPSPKSAAPGSTRQPTPPPSSRPAPAAPLPKGSSLPKGRRLGSG